MSEKDVVIVYKDSGLGGLYWLFAVVYTFMKWGFLWGIVSLVFPVFPVIDLVKWLIA